MTRRLEFRRHTPAWRTLLAGIAAGWALLVLALAHGAVHLPNEAAFQTTGRIFDSLTPHLLVAAAGLSLLVLLLGQRLVGVLLLVGAAFGWVAMDRAVSERSVAFSEAAPSLRILWFNALGNNQTDPDVLARALIASDADIIAIGEGQSLRPALETLHAVYPAQHGCVEACDLMVFSRLPGTEFEQHSLTRFSLDRLVELRLAGTETHAPVTIVAAHIAKPWFDVFAVADEQRVARLMRRTEGATVLIGDFNAAPWSRRMRVLADRTGMRFGAETPATWPERAGRFGIPIDHVMVGPGVGLAALAPWGAGLGSNHLGLLAEIVLPPPASDG